MEKHACNAQEASSGSEDGGALYLDAEDGHDLNAGGDGGTCCADQPHVVIVVFKKHILLQAVHMKWICGGTEAGECAGRISPEAAGLEAS